MTLKKRSKVVKKRSKVGNYTGPTKAMKEVSFILDIKTDRPNVKYSNLGNVFVHTDAKLISVEARHISYYNCNTGELTYLTTEEKQKPGFVGSTMTLYNKWSDNDGNMTSETTKTFRTTKGFFTINEVVKKICVFEMIDRPKSNWFGGIDAHHIHYENMSRGNKGYIIHYGS